MDPAHPDLMTMEAFQRATSVHSYDPQEHLPGPGQFPDSSPANGDSINTDGNANGNGNANSNGLPQDDGVNKNNGSDAHYSSGQDNEDLDDVDGANVNFVFANEKRFSDFHALFRSVPDEEKLIEDYGCALQKEILVQGRLYISENHVCFNANIFGWVTNLVIAFSEITAIEKRFTAFVIPNAISIVTTTCPKGHFLASFLSRDAAHDLLMAAWRKSFPCAANASASVNNIYFRQNRSNLTLNEDDDARSFISARPTSETRKNRHRRSSSASQNWTADEGDWDDDDTDVNTRGTKRAAVKRILQEVIAPLADGASGSSRKGRARSVSELPPRPSSFDYGGTPNQRPSFDLNGGPPNGTRLRAGTESLPTSNAGRGAVAAATNGGQQSAGQRSSTSCKCSKEGKHYSTTFLSETYPGTIQAMWTLLFESDFNKAFLTNDAMKGADVQEDSWKKAPDGTLSKVTKYIKWLGMPIGPKTTKAILTDVCENKNFDEYVSTVTTTSTPDVPSGGSFSTKCRTCITWAGPNQVQVLVTGAVEFTKSSWIKGQIEKGAAEGMGTHYKELNNSIRKHIAAHPADFPTSGAAPGATANGEQPPAPTNGTEETVSSAPQVVDDRPSEQQAGAAAVGSQGSKSGEAGLPNGGVAKESFGQSLLSWVHGEGLSQAMLVSVLLVVMVVNIYIWFQISNVSAQIEKIQGDVLLQRTRPRPVSAMQYKRGPKEGRQGEEQDYEDNLSDEEYTVDQEEAMWAWLTEREVHRAYRRPGAEDWEKMRSSGHDASSTEEDGSARAELSDEDDLLLTEAKLQARINKLQMQLEALERAVERDNNDASQQ